jgi:hypothetical protein
LGDVGIAAAGEGGYGPIFSPIGSKVKPLELGPVKSAADLH